VSKKLKIVLVIVAIGAGFLAYKGVKYVHVLANQGYFQEGTPLPGDDTNCPTCDPDHDGLNNQQEIIWQTDPFNADTDGDGFKDGEEVNSGHNPLVPGPDDLINDNNLTSQLSDLTVAGIYEGAINPASDSYSQTLGDIASSVADNATYIFNKTVSADSLNTVGGSQEANVTYLKTLGPMLQQFGTALSDDFSKIKDNLNTIGSAGFSNQIKASFAQQSTTYADVYASGQTMSVPKPFANSHADFLSMTQQMQTITDALAHGDQDPVKASFALDSLGGMYDKYSTYLQDLSNIISAQHLDTADLGN
jgi:hypothetical protein